MLQRSGVWAALIATWVAGIVLGTSGAALRTDAGRRIVTRHALALANERLNGSVTVGEIGGSLLSGLEAQDIEIRGADSSVIAEVAHLRFGYGLLDLLRGRIVLGHLVLTGPRFDLIKPASGRPYNIEELFAPAAGAGGGGGSSPLIAFNNVQITDGMVVLRSPTDSLHSGIEGERGPEGALRIRRFEDVNAKLDYLRISSPLPVESAIRIDVGRFRATVSDPAVTVTDVRGRLDVQNDTIALALDRLRLPDTETGLTGTVSWSSGPVMLDLVARASQANADDVRGLVSEIPASVVGSGNFTIESIRSNAVRVWGERLDLAGRGGGGRMRGTLGILVGPGENWEFERTQLDLSNFDLEYVRGFLDTLPVAGRVTGRFEAHGPRELLRLRLDVVFRDSLVPGWPESSLRGAGDASVGVPGDFVFRQFELESANLSLATVHRLLPAVTLVGRIRGSGTLDGPWLESKYEGELRHVDGVLPESVARGSVRIDGRGDTLGVWADVEFDSLRLAGLQTSYPEFDVPVSLGGRLLLNGYLDSLGVEADVAGPVGGVLAEGMLAFGSPLKGVHALEVDLQDFDLQAVRPPLPATRLTGQITVGGGATRTGSPTWSTTVALDRSEVEGVRVDSARAVLELADSMVRIDTVAVFGALRVAGGGELGWRKPLAGTLTLSAGTSSLRAVEPWLAAWLGPLKGDAGAPPPSGEVGILAQLEGALDDYRLVSEVQLIDMQRGEVRASRARGTASWQMPSRRITVDGRVDSLSFGGLSLSDAEARVHGAVDSLNWYGRFNFARDGWGAAIGAGSVAVDSSARRIVIDSLSVRLASSGWLLDTAAVLVVRDSTIQFSNVAFTSDRTAGHVEADGEFPLQGPGRLDASIVALPVQDLWLLLHREWDDVGGELNGTVQLSGRARSPNIEAFLALRSGFFGEFRAPYVEAILDYDDHRLKGDITLRELTDRLLRIDVDLPVDLAFTDVAERQLPGRLDVRAVADGVDLSLLGQLTPMARRTSGTLNADFGITGTWERPELTGELSIVDGAATYPTLGVRHRDLNGTLALSGDTIYVRDFSVSSGEGSAQVSGFVRLEELSRPLLRVHVNAREFHALDLRGFLALTATADLNVAGPLYDATLTGSGTATQGILYFADLVTKDIVNLEGELVGEVLDAEELERIREQGLGAAFESRFLDSLRIDNLRLDMGSEVWLRSEEANIQLAGAVSVDKERDRYRLSGTLETPRGTYRLELPPAIARDFAVTRGEVSYFGTSDLNADLDIEARHIVRTREQDVINVYVHIGGTLYTPKLTFTSDVQPPVSEAEIISYLIFGAPSVQAFTGAGGVNNLVIAENVLGALSGQLEYALISDLGVPLDYLEIRPTGISSEVLGAEIAMGKQFNIFGTSAFFTASPRICPKQLGDPFNLGGSVEFRLSRQWLLSASREAVRACETGEASSSPYQLGIDLFWETRF